MNNQLSFEKPLLELRKKIKELRTFTAEKEIDLSEEIAKLEAKAERLEKEIYENLTAWQKVQIARLPSRPTTLHYIRTIFTDFLEFHGDRAYVMIQPLVGGIAKFEGIPVTVIGHERGTRYKRKNQAEFWFASSRRLSKSIAIDATSG